MPQVTFDTPVLRVEGLFVKFDIIPVSGSLAVLLGSRDLALIVQQLHYWGRQGYGEIIDGVRWIYKPIREWIEEVFPTFSPWQLGKLMKELVERGIVRRSKLFTKHQIQKGDRFWWQPKNQTYYYSLNTEKLQELAHNYQSPQKEAETPENSESLKTQILSNEEINNTKFSDCTKNNTENTSTENSSKDQSHPTLPKSEGGIPGEDNQDKQHTSNSELSKVKEVNSVNSKAVKFDTSSALVEQKVNQNMSTDKRVVRLDTGEVRKIVEKPTEAVGAEETVRVDSGTSREEVSPVARRLPSPKPKAKTPVGARSARAKLEDATQERRLPHSRLREETSPGSHLKGTKPKRKDKAPWKDEGQFKRFYRALIQALPIVANSHSPQGLAQTIIVKLRRGEPHTYWDDFVAGLPIGTSTKPEWEIEPGIPYPMFVEYLTEKIKRGDNTTTNEQTRNEVFRILNQPRIAKAFWGQFKRSVVNVSEQVERARALGVSHPSTPVWTKERIEPSIEEAAAAGEKIMAVNGNASAAIASSSTESQSKPRSPAPQLKSDVASFEVPDPWTDESSPESSPQPTMRELLTEVLGERNQWGFVKAMPQVSQTELKASEREKTSPKTHISQMSVAEINDYLADPITRKELMPQLMHSDYELITNEYGDIIGVRRPKP